MDCPKCKRALPDDAAFCCYCGKKLVAAERKARKRPNHAGTMYKVSGRRSKPWAASRDKVFLGYFPTKADAQAELERTARRSLSDAYNMTLEEVQCKWKVERYPELADKSIEAYDLAWKLFEPLKGRKMRELRTEDFQKLVDAQVKQGRSRSQCEKIRSLYSQLCKYAMREDILDKNYASFLRLPKAETKQRDTFTAKELEILRTDAATCDTSKLILILIYTGLRINELLKLPMSGVDLEERTITGGEKTEAGRNRVVPIHPLIWAYVQHFHLAGEGKSGALFLRGYDGDRDAHNFRARQYYPTLQRLGLSTEARPMNPHACRYTFATMAAQAGVDREALQKLMGHAQYSTTANIYIQKDVDMLRAEIEKIGMTDSKVIVTETQ